jgi:hypothetical protein
MNLSGVLDREMEREEQPNLAYCYPGALVGTVVELTSMVA